MWLETNIDDKTGSQIASVDKTRPIAVQTQLNRLKEK